jgi:hypothetical protein
VTIVGKCKTFIKALHDKNARIERLIDVLNSAVVKPRDRFTARAESKKILIPFDCDGDDVAKLYLSVVMGDIPYTYEGKSIRLYFESDIERMHGLFEWKNAFQGRVRGFLSQFGAFSKQGKNTKEKNAMLLDSIHASSRILCALRECGKCAALREKDLSIDTASIARVKAIRVKQ